MFLGRERGREVHGHARLPHASLAGRDGDHRRRLRERDPALGHIGAPAPKLVHEGLALLRAHGGKRDLDALDAVERPQGRRHIVRDPVLERAALDRDEDPDRDRASVDVDALQHADVLDRAADLGIHHTAQCLADPFLGDHAGPFRP